MVDGLKLLVTDGRIILVILQEKAEKTNEEHLRLLIGNQEIILPRTLITIQREESADTAASHPQREASIVSDKI